MQLIGYLLEGLVRRGEVWVDLDLFPTQERAESAALAVRRDGDRIMETRICQYMRGPLIEPDRIAVPSCVRTN